jgi:predicted CXXCH cytochrome family protein
MNALFRPVLLSLLILGSLALVPAGTARAEEPNCGTCHEALSTGKSVHAAVSMGCASCHSAINAADVPHKVTNKNPHGLMSKMRDLCYSCHDKKPFMKNTVHGALMLGCTSCHNPHASDHAHLLKEDIPRLCLNCHKESLMAQKGGTHVLAGNEACSTCHNPHATDTPKLFESGRNASLRDRTALAGSPAVAPQ